MTLPIHSAIFSLESLEELQLEGCELVCHVPQDFTGFKKLKTLILNPLYIMVASDLYRLLSTCSALENLVLETGDEHVENDDVDRISIVELFKCFQNLRSLFIFYTLTLKFAPGNPLPVVLPDPLANLTELKMDSLRVSHRHQLPVFLLLINSSPRLEKLRIHFDDRIEVADATSSWACSAADYLDMSCCHLTLFEAHGLNINRSRELDVVRLVVAKSPALKEAKFVTTFGIDEAELNVIRMSLITYYYRHLPHWN